MATRTRRNFSITLGLNEEAARSLDKKLDFLQNVYFGATKSRAELLIYLWNFGLNFHWGRAKNGLGPLAEQKLEIEGLPDLALVYDMIETQKAKQQVVDTLITLYEDIGLDAFVEACAQYGIEWEPLLMDKFSFHTEPQTWTSTTRRKLDVYLADKLPTRLKTSANGPQQKKSLPQKTIGQS